MSLIRGIFRKKPAGRTGHAVILNHTASSYHWGCYATSMMIVNGLLDAGFSTATFDVETTHSGLGTAPENFSPEQMNSFADQLHHINPALVRAIYDCDLVVVNGEGTLHHFHNAPRALLSLIWMAKHRAKKPVHLINHSCFPTGDGSLGDTAAEQLYLGCLSSVDRVVVRDQWSGQVYSRFGLQYENGFDCLPLYTDRYMTPLPKVSSSVVIGAASHWTRDIALTVGCALQAIGNEVLSDAPVFLSGGHRRSPSEDEMHFDVLKTQIPSLRMVKPTSLGEWLGWINSSSLLITGRFHHLVSAAALSTPVVFFPGNTAKNDAIGDMLGFPQPLDPEDPLLIDKLAIWIKSPSQTTRSQSKLLIAKAEKNLQFLA